MALNKKASFQKIDIELAEFAKAISHPARIAILKNLAEKNACICGEIVEILPLAQATVSQHLKELKNIGLIKGEVEGVKSCYCLNWEKITQFQTMINEFNETIHHFKNQNNCC